METFIFPFNQTKSIHIEYRKANLYGMYLNRTWQNIRLKLYSIFPLKPYKSFNLCQRKCKYLRNVACLTYLLILVSMLCTFYSARVASYSGVAHHLLHRITTIFETKRNNMIEDAMNRRRGRRRVWAGGGGRGRWWWWWCGKLCRRLSVSKDNFLTRKRTLQWE